MGMTRRWSVVPLLWLALWMGLAAGARAAEPLHLPFYEVRSAHGHLYLLGTIHVGSERFYPLPEAVEAAFAQCPVLVLELDPARVDGAALAARITYAPGESLDQHVSAATMDLVRQVVPGLGLPAEAARRLRPAWLAVVLGIQVAQKAGYDARLGIDLHLAGRAHAAGKTVEELESMDQQWAMIDGMPAPLQEAFLEASLKSVAAGRAGPELDAIVQAWSQADLDALAEVEHRFETALSQDDARALRERMSAQRNAAMLERLLAMLEDSTERLVAVGTLHLAGEDGLLAGLRRHGFEPVQR